MIGPALVHPRVPHGPWTYEPHAHGRTLSSVFFGLGLPFVFNSGFVYFFYICLGIFSAFVLGSCIFLQHWYWFLLPSFRVVSPSPGLILDPLFSGSSLNTRCGGIYSLISLFRIAASSTPPFLIFWDELCYHPPTTVWSAYTTIQGGRMWCGVYQVGYREGRINRRNFSRTIAIFYGI